MEKKRAQEWANMIGRAMAGNGRLADGTTLLEKYPKRYANPFTDWVGLLIAEAKANASLENKEKRKGENSDGNPDLVQSL